MRADFPVMARLASSMGCGKEDVALSKHRFGVSSDTWRHTGKRQPNHHDVPDLSPHRTEEPGQNQQNIATYIRSW